LQEGGQYKALPFFLSKIIAQYKGMVLSERKLDFFINEYSKLIEPAMAELLVCYVDKKYKDIMKYQVFTGGKRLRPALAIVSCQLAGGKARDAVFAAAGLEIIHNYSLIVDDIIDKSFLRRNKPTTWAKFGKSIAECAAVDHSCAVFQAANKSKKPREISELFSRTLKTIMDGEILDILFEQAGRNNEPFIVKNRYHDIKESDYLEMVRKKTASLFEACCEAGGIIGGASKKQLKALKSYGLNLGLAFQIQDDILDIFGKTKSLGKKVGKDIMERKGGNIIIMSALKELQPQDRHKILATMKKDELGDEDVENVMKLIVKTASMQNAYRLEKKFIERAKESLGELPDNNWRKILEEVSNFMIIREK
jgi:geranylgeranyl diphosphate synthase, type I